MVHHLSFVDQDLGSGEAVDRHFYRGIGKGILGGYREEGIQRDLILMSVAVGIVDDVVPPLVGIPPEGMVLLLQDPGRSTREGIERTRRFGMTGHQQYDLLRTEASHPCRAHRTEEGDAHPPVIDARAAQQGGPARNRRAMQSQGDQAQPTVECWWQTDLLTVHDAGITESVRGISMQQSTPQAGRDASEERYELDAVRVMVPLPFSLQRRKQDADRAALGSGRTMGDGAWELAQVGTCLNDRLEDLPDLHARSHRRDSHRRKIEGRRRRRERELRSRIRHRREIAFGTQKGDRALRRSA